MRVRMFSAAVLVCAGAILGTFWGGILLGFAACWLLTLWVVS